MSIGAIGGTGMGSFGSSASLRHEAVETQSAEALVPWHELGDTRGRVQPTRMTFGPVKGAVMDDLVMMR